MTEHMTDRGCPTEEVWLEFLDARGDGDLVADRGALERHLDACGDCRTDVDELRRFNTLLLRTRVPGLNDEQWRVLDERMEMMGSEYVPPPRIATRIYFGMAMAAAIGLFAVGLWHLIYVDPAAEQLRKTLPPAAPSQVIAAAALQAGAVEGALELADAKGAWRPLTAGTMLDASARVRNAAGSGNGRLVVPGHFELRVAAGSELQFIAADERNTWLRLRGGEVACTVEKRRPHQQFRVLAGRFRASVIGTEFVVTLGREKAAVQVRVSEGAVRVDEADEADAATSESMTVVRAGNRWRSVGGRIEYGPIAAPAPAERPGPEQAPAQAPAGEQPAAGTSGSERAFAAQGTPADNTVARKRRKRADSGAKADQQQLRPAAATTAEPAAAPAKAKVVEIEVPAQWHPEAEAAEVERLKRLDSHSETARKGKAAAKPGAPDGWNKAAEDKPDK